MMKNQQWKGTASVVVGKQRLWGEARSQGALQAPKRTVALI